MSIRALNWAFDVEGITSSQKFILVALADYANENGKAYPSTETLCRKTLLNRKTVISSLDDLEKRKLIADTGQRVGKTKQIKVYRIAGGVDAKYPDIGTLPENKASQKRDGKDSQKREGEASLKRDTEPSGEPSEGNQEGTASPLPVEMQYWNSKPDLRKVLTCSGDREKKLRARRAEPFWVKNLSAAIDKVCLSAFCTGKNGRGWKATFDWLLRPGTVAKIMEGNYENDDATKTEAGDQTGDGPENF